MAPSLSIVVPTWNEDAMTAADLPVEVLEVEGVLRGWSVEETHGAMIERTRNRSGVPAIVMAPYREQEEEHRKHRALMRHAIELAARAILRGNGNDGHLYGLNLSPAEKSILIEYLKTR